MKGDIFIYGGIGTEVGEISADEVRRQISANKDASELTVHIISPGGDVFEGEAIYNALKNSGKKLTGHIEGTCASIATLIIGACDKIIMNKTGRFMIHNPKISGFNRDADSRELRSVAQQLDQIKGLLIDVWRKKPSIKVENDKLWELYDNETWLTAEQAEQMGFVDESVDAIKAVAKVDLNKIRNDMKDTSQLKAMFSRVINLLKFKNEMEETLQDGTKVIVMSEDGDFTGKQVVYEDGSPLPPGEHPLVSGKVLVVGDNSTITEVKEAEAPADNAMDKDKEIENLKAQLAEATTKLNDATNQLSQANANVATAKAETMKFKNRTGEIEKQFLALQEEVQKTIGEEPPKHRGPAVIVNKQEQENFDPMGEEALSYFTGRNLSK